MLLVDTGPLVAAANRADPDHGACAALLATHPGPLVVSALVVAEAGYLVGKYLGPGVEAALLRALAAERYRVQAPTAGDLRRAAELVERYGDLPLGSTDATLVALAERLDLREVATLDHRHFSVVRPRHTEAFVLRP